MPADIPSSPAMSYGLGHEIVPIYFLGNGASTPTVYSGPFVSSISRDSAGTYTVTLRGFSPKAFLGGSLLTTGSARLTLTSVTITAATKTVTLVFVTRNATGTAADGSLDNWAILNFKTYSGRDSTGR